MCPQKHGFFFIQDAPRRDKHAECLALAEFWENRKYFSLLRIIQRAK